MQKPRSFRSSALRGLAGALVGLAALAAALIAPADTRPYAEAPYSRTTFDRLSSSDAITSPRSALQAGFGQASLTPDLDAAADDPERGAFPGLPLAGFSSRRGAPASGVHDPLRVKAIAVAAGGKRVVFVSADLLLVPRGVERQLTAALPSLGLEPGGLYLAATHTHSGPGGWGDTLAERLSAGRARAGFEDWIAGRVEAAVRAALADLKPATLLEGQAESPDLVKNRTEKGGPAHGAFPFLVFAQDGGRKAILGAFAAHPVMLGADNFLFSADYPGAWERSMEARGYALAAFMAGPVGGQTPRHPRGSFAEAEAYGTALADRVAAASSSPLPESEAEIGSVRLAVDLPQGGLPLAPGWQLRAWASRLVLPLRKQSFIEGVRIGRSVWIATPADFAGELALPIEADLAKRGFLLSVTSFNGDYLGYIMPSRRYGDPGYETRDMAFFGPAMGDYMSDLVRRLADALTR